MSNDITGRIVNLFGKGDRQQPTSDLVRQVETLGKVVHELLEGLGYVHKALEGSAALTKDLMAKSDKLRRDLDLLLAASKLMADNIDALTTKVCEIERQTSKLP